MLKCLHTKQNAHDCTVEYNTYRIGHYVHRIKCIIFQIPTEAHLSKNVCGKDQCARCPLVCAYKRSPCTAIKRRRQRTVPGAPAAACRSGNARQCGPQQATETPDTYYERNRRPTCCALAHWRRPSTRHTDVSPGPASHMSTAGAHAEIRMCAQATASLSSLIGVRASSRASLIGPTLESVSRRTAR